MFFKKLKLRGFKIYKDEIEFDFAARTSIFGDNRHGKSTIGDAITWICFGGTMIGKSTKVDQLINKESEQAFGELVFLDDGGTEHTLQRVKNRHGQIIYLDGLENTSQARVDQILGDMDLFLSMFNPYYFNEILKDKERRELINKYAGIVDMEELFEEFGPRELIKKHDINIRKPKEYERFRDKLKLIQGEMTAHAQEMNLLFSQNQIQIPQNQIVDDAAEAQLKAQIDSYHNAAIENKEIEMQWQRYNELVAQHSNIQKQAAEKQAEIAALVSVEPPPNAATDETLLALRAEIDAITIMAVPSFSDISNLEKCPLCYTDITPDHKKHVTDWQKQELAKVTAHNEAANQAKLIVQNKIHNREQEIQALTKQYNDFVVTRDSLLRAKAQFESMSTIPEAPTRGLYDLSALPAIQQQYESVAAANNEARVRNAEIAQLYQQNQQRAQRITFLRDQTATLEAQKSDLDIITKALSTNGVFRKACEVKAASIQSELTRCKIVLDELVKSTGEYKEVFHIYWDQTEYWAISKSEKIRCGLEIGNYLRHRSGRNVPSFIDDSESITQIENEYLSADQIFYARVTPGQALTIHHG